MKKKKLYFYSILSICLPTINYATTAIFRCQNVGNICAQSQNTHFDKTFLKTN